MTPTTTGLPSGEQAAAISRLLVQTMADYTGRGPLKARTHINTDCITVVLEETLTKGERSLVRDREGDTVLAMRRAYQRAASEILIKGVEVITGREVMAFMSANHLSPDFAAEVFILRKLQQQDAQLED
jgi:uncharacterized protein YbcI